MQIYIYVSNLINLCYELMLKGKETFRLRRSYACSSLICVQSSFPGDCVKQTYDRHEQHQFSLRLFSGFVLLAVYLKWRHFPCFLLAGRSNDSVHLLGLMGPMSVSEWIGIIIESGKRALLGKDLSLVVIVHYLSHVDTIGLNWLWLRYSADLTILILVRRTILQIHLPYREEDNILQGYSIITNFGNVICVKRNWAYLTFDFCLVPSTGTISLDHMYVRMPVRCNFNLTVITLSLVIFLLLEITW